MLSALRKMFKKEPPAPLPEPPPPPTGVVRAAMTATGSGWMGKGNGPGMLNMDEVMAAAGEDARQNGITSDIEIRNRKLASREALKSARLRAVAEQRPVEFHIGTLSFIVVPPPAPTPPVAIYTPTNDGKSLQEVWNNERQQMLDAEQRGRDREADR